MMKYTILDCYTDEPAGLGVPPYLGTYPRYIYGMLCYQGFQPNYITIDDLRLLKHFNNKKETTKDNRKTNIWIYNTTNQNVNDILSNTDILIIILGVHVPGKYLSAIPGTMKEILPMLSDLNCKKILTGPAVFGTRGEGGKFSERVNNTGFDEIKQFGFEFGGFDKLQDYAIRGAELQKLISDIRIIEIETGRGCNIGRCSFCTEPIKNKFVNRKTDDIVAEIQRFYQLGSRHFRLGKQSDFYSIEDPINLLKKIREKCPDIKVLHIDNVNPVFVLGRKGIEITKAIVKYCTEGNVAAFGVESFDPVVIKENFLNCKLNTAVQAIKILNEHGAERGPTGMPKFLPGINLIFGLGYESKSTHLYNMTALTEILDKGWMLRRINIRQVAILPNTLMNKFGMKYINKNKRYYWKWRNEIRQKIDFEMLKRVAPYNHILKDVFTEIYDGKTTFMRQIGSYPLIIGVKKKIILKKFVQVKVKRHMLRSIEAEVVE